MAFASVIVFLASLVLCWAQYDYGFNPGAKKYTREIRIKQGMLQGIVVEPRRYYGLAGCEQYLGIPYAAPPVGELRFMPPNSAPTWSGTRYVDKHGPVCPQTFPNVTAMSATRKANFKRLAKHLAHEDEDCLYLNIYAPIQEPSKVKKKYPVILYIHGESYEWNSGNAYDGCILASYGQVIFITMNFRLGILGFLQVGVNNTLRNNFGLIDQVAALVWIQENIAKFGGNPNSVTLMGHGTGAACVSLLMVSPMMMGEEGDVLFHRGILMSGTALADWALASNSVQLNIQVAHQLNCDYKKPGELAACLRQKRVSDIMSVSVMAPPFVTKFGPVVDNWAVPNIPTPLMSKYHDLFSKYELLCGVTQIESDQLLGNVELYHGLFEDARDKMLREYLEARFKYRPDLALASTLKEYTNLSASSVLEYRNTVLDVLTDARVVAPVIQTSKYHSAVNPKSYFYVFGYSSAHKKYLQETSIHGEELPYVFGVPLDPAASDHSEHYTDEEKLFSEIIMTLWSNFAHTGNPNARIRNSFLTLNERWWQAYWPEYWPEFDKINQSYLLLALPPSVGTKYREQLTNYWNEYLPDLLQNYTKGQAYFIPRTARPVPQRPVSTRLHMTDRPPHVTPPYRRVTSTEPSRIVRPTGPSLILPTDVTLKDSSIEKNEETPSTTMHVLITVGTLFLLVNIATFAGLYYKRKKLKKQEKNLKRQYEDTNLLPTGESPPTKKIKLHDIGNEAAERGCNVMKMIRQSTKSEDTYEAVVKPGEESTNSNPRSKLARQISTSTIDPHTKVRDWIAHEIVQKCSPRFLRRTRQQFALEHKMKQQREHERKKGNKASDTKTLVSSSTPGKKSIRPISPQGKNWSTPSSTKTGSNSMSNKHSNEIEMLKKPKKVSVAVDATPAARSSSVLKQKPIELSKSMDLTTVEQERPPLRRSVTMEDFISLDTKDSDLSLRRSITSMNLKSNPSVEEENTKIRYEFPASDSDIIKIHHQHSRSDPVQMTLRSPEEFFPHGTLKMKTFDASVDVNVTSRDESKINDSPLSPEEALQTIKRRKFPKVLPDLPALQAQNNALKRRSLPPQNLLILSSLPENRALKPNSSTSLKNYSRIPPAPPPRISSTLGRKPSNTAPLYHPSPVKLADEPPSPQEPVITSNTLHVGPLIPCRQPRRIIDTLENGSHSYKLNTQPIYDNLRTPAEKDIVSEPKKTVPKMIITTDPLQPVKKLEQPKVIIKPSISRKVNDPTKINKVIPRVIAKDVSTESEHEIDNKDKKKLDNDGKLTASQKQKFSKLSQIPTFCKNTTASSKSQSSTDSSSSTFDGSDTGTVVKKV